MPCTEVPAERNEIVMRSDSQVLRRNEIAHIGALPGEHLVIKALLPVDVGDAVLQLLNGAAQRRLFLRQHLFPLGDGGRPLQAEVQIDVYKRQSLFTVANG